MLRAVTVTEAYTKQPAATKANRWEPSSHEHLSSNAQRHVEWNPQKEDRICEQSICTGMSLVSPCTRTCRPYSYAFETHRHPKPQA